MSTKTVSVICFLRYGKLLSCNVRNAPRGCLLAGDKAFETSFVSLTGKYFLTKCNI